MADEKIVYYYKELVPGIHHKYVIYLDSNGDVKGWARLGQSSASTAPAYGKESPASVDYPMGKLYGAHGDASTWNDANPDFDDTLENGGASERGSSVAGEAADLSDEWDQLTANIDAIDAAEHPYDPATTNCNSGMDTAASDVSTTDYPDGLNLPDNDDLAPGEYYAPGSGITVDGPGGGYVQWAVAEFLGWVLERFIDGQTAGSPLVLDLDDSGTIELTSLANATAYWDNDENGFRSLSGWVTGGDGLLALDVNSNGIIDDNGELFGTVDTNGFAILAAYDSNDDGFITEEDTAWSDLIVWVDADEDGYSESAELFSMADLDITSFDLNASEVSSTNEGHAVTHTSTFTVDTGGGPDTRIVHDVWFQYDSVNTFYTQTEPLDEAISLIPSLRGYGTLPDLHFVISSDDTGGGNLRDLVLDLYALPIDELFVDDATVFDAVKDIMFRWAGVDGVASDSRGDYVDARELEFLEAMTGTPFLQRGWMEDPAYFAGLFLDEAFHIAQNNIFARFAAQGAGGALFAGDWHYDISGDSFVGVTGLDTGVLDDLETLAGSQTNKDEFWKGIVAMVEFAVGVANLPGGDQTALDDAIFDSDNSLDLAQIMDSLDWQPPIGTTYNGTSGNDILTGGTGDDEINGNNGDDTINGGLGADSINAGGDDDTINGQSGDDIVLGGSGDDVYMYEAGHGNDVYEDTGGYGAGDDDDRILLGAGFDIGDLTLTRVSNNDLLIELDNGVVTGSILIQDQFNDSGSIETIEFNDTSTYSLIAQNYTLTGSAAGETLRGAKANSSSGSDTIYGMGGNDIIYVNAPSESDSAANTVYGGDGDDTIYGNDGADTLDGGAGDDVLDGGSGNDDLTMGSGNDEAEGDGGDDTFRFVSGNDWIADSAGTDVLRLDAAWNSNTPDYYRIGSNMKIVFDDDNSITIYNHFVGGKAVESMVYADTTTVNLTTVTYTVQGDEGNNTLTGGSGADTFYGYGGNDTMTGNGGNDLMYGGTGNDTINANAGNDYIEGGAGDDTMNGGADNDEYLYVSGHDVINETSGGTDLLEILAGWAWADLTFRRYWANANDLVIEINGSNSITVDGHFNSGDAMETLRLNDGTGDVTLTSLQYETYGTSGLNTINPITVNGSLNDIMYGLAGNDTLNGGNGDDTLNGGDDTDTLNGDAGNDVLYGDAGNDTLNGNADNDTMDGGAGNDDLHGAGGNDTFIYAAGLDDVGDTGGTDTLWIKGGVTVNDITFSNVSTNDTEITINASVDEILVDNLRNGNANYHIETILFDDGFYANLPSYQSWTNGTSGNDTTTGTGSANVIIGFAGNDTIDGDGGNDNVHGGSGNDDIQGGSGADLLHGGTGDDVLYGEDGDDTLYGGAGVDTFTFEAASAFNNIDDVMDFSTAQGDKLDIADLLSGFNPTTSDILDFVSFVNDSGDSKMYVDRDGTAGTYSSAQMALVHGVTDLDADELLTGGYLIAA